jgi:guanylate kinase
MTKGILLVISAPSGAGKSTLCRALAERRKGLLVSVSSTTRAPRGEEKDGVDYHFLSKAEFEKREKAGGFVETARVHDHFYGTPKPPLEAAMAAGRDVLLNIDTQGARSVKAHFPDCVRVFVLPPSWKVLEDRLRKRAQDEPAVIAKRLANARGEVSRLAEFDYAVINDRLEDAVEDLLAILRAEGRKVSRAAADLKRSDFLNQEEPS